jgi:ornithine cyclodeaminase
MMQVRDFTKLRVWSHDKAEADEFATDLAAGHSLEFDVADTTDEAVADADVVCTVTSAPTPILKGSAVRPGTHVNLVGSSHRGAAEADAALVRMAEFFVDFRPSTLDQAGEFLDAMERGIVTEDHIKAEIGEVLSGTAAGRSDRSAVTVYKSLGVASQDIVTARRIYERAIDQALGTVANL